MRGSTFLLVPLCIDVSCPPLDNHSVIQGPYFVLKAKNHQVIGQSRMYESYSGCTNGIGSCKENGATDAIKDLTEG